MLQPSFLLSLLAALLFSNAQQQLSTTLPFVSPSDCKSTEFFDSSRLACSPCSNGSMGDRRGSCRCPPGARLLSLSPSGLAPVCEPCPNGTRSSPDGQSCLACPTANCSSLSCGTSAVLSYRHRNGEIADASCVACTNGTEPDDAGEQCTRCAGRGCLCEKGSDTTCPAVLPLSSAPSLSTIFFTTGMHRDSPRLRSDSLFATARRCELGSAVDCQALANWCVLQNYDRDLYTACSIFEAIANRPTTNQWAPNMPWLFYYSMDATSDLRRAGVITQAFMFDDAQNSRLDVVAARYLLNGSFDGWIEVSGGELLLCPSSTATAESAFAFGRRFRQQCSMSLAKLLRSSHGQQPLFYDLFLRFRNSSGGVELYPIPVVNELIRRNGAYVNREPGSSSSSWLLTRRFFLVDAYSLFHSENNTLTGARVARDVTFNIAMMESRDGLIYPPYARIAYEELQGNITTQEIPLTFTVRYSIDPTRHDKDLEIAMAVLASVTVLWAALRAYSWGRRAGKQLVDAATLVQFLLFECAVLGDVFLFVVTVTVCWLLFAYKAQSYIFYNQLTDSQETTLLAYLIAATALKVAALLHRYLMLMFTETFFIDWERPKTAPRTDIPRPPTHDQNADEGIKEQPVVICNNAMVKLGSDNNKHVQVIIVFFLSRRTYLVANEWNELQSYRKTSLAVQLLLMLFLLDWVGCRHWAIWQPHFSTHEPPLSVLSSVVSRMAVSLFLYIFIGFCQWILNVFIVERILLDPFHNFIDLCSIANISVFSLTHPLSGFYIHGRSVHGWADTGMSEMNEFLQRERDCLVGMRGLETNSELQTYQVALPVAFRKRYDELIKQRYTDAAAAARDENIDLTTAQISSTAKAHASMNKFLQEVVEHAAPDCDYTLRERTALETLLDIELSDTSTVGVFTRDHSESAFSLCFSYGNEWSMLSFETALFSLCFALSESSVLAAGITFLSAALLRLISSLLFTNHLVKSSLVDHRFLI